MEAKPPITKGTIIRTIILFIALANQLLISAGYSPLPIDDMTVELLVSTLFTVGAAIWAWWKNNSLTRKARKADQLAKKEGLK